LPLLQRAADLQPGTGRSFSIFSLISEEKKLTEYESESRHFF
jgi:hypothetical protein